MNFARISFDQKSQKSTASKIQYQTNFVRVRQVSILRTTSAYTYARVQKYDKSP